MPDPDATQDDALIEQLPTAYPTDVPADHALDPGFVPAEGFDEGLEVTS